MSKRTFASIALAAALGTSAAQSATLEDVERSFYPYKDSAPTMPGLEPGMTINSGNVAQFEDAFDLDIPEDEEAIRTVGDAVKYIQEQSSKKSD